MAAKLNFLLIGIFLLLSVFFATTIRTSADTWWHLAVGRQVWQEKAVPTTDKFIYGPTDKTFNSVEWLSDLVFYGFYQVFGINGLVMIRLICGLSAIYVLFLTLSLITKNRLIIALSLSLAGYIMAYRLYDRPEIFSLVLVAIVNYLCFYYFLKRMLSWVTFLLPLIFLAWPNVQPSETIGLGILGFFSFFFILRERFEKTKQEKLPVFITIAILSAFTSLVQYKRFFIFLEIGKLTSSNLTEFAPLKSRLFATHGYDFFGQIPYYFYLYLVIILLYSVLLAIKIFRDRKVKFESQVLIFYLLVLLAPFRLYRLIPIISLISIPSLVYLAKETQIHKNIISPALLTVCLVLTSLLLIISILTGQIAGVKEFTFVAHTQSGEVLGVSFDSWNFDLPRSFPDVIRQSLNSQRLFTTPQWNNFVIWEIPNVKIFADALFYNRAQNDYIDEGTLASGKNNWQTLLKEYNIDTIINTQDYFNFPVNVPVYTLGNWKLVYVDSNAVLYAREDVIKNLPIDLSAIHPELENGLKFKTENEKQAIDQLTNLLAFDSKNGFARMQLITYYLDKDPQKAKTLAEESRQVLPDQPAFRLDLAKLYLAQNNCPLAIQFAQEGLRKSFNHYVYKVALNDIEASCSQN